MFDQELSEIKQVLDIIKQEMSNAPDELKKSLGFYYNIIMMSLRIANWAVGLLIKIDQVLEKAGYKVSK